jgi:hypothetical protein
MRTRKVIKVLAGSIAIYVIMAACSAASGPQSAASRDGGPAGGSGSGGGAMGDGSGGASAMDAPSVLDALTDPVSEAAADPNQSGTRLKVQFYAGADGSKLGTGAMFDSQLNVTCYFGEASDGTIRCLPVPSSNTVTIATQNFFSEASCTQALGVALGGACAAPPTVISMSVTNACTTTTTTYQAGSQFTGTLYQSSSTGCAALSSASQAALVADGFKFYSLGAQIPPPDPSQYVEGTLQTEP